jgi:hypothetical protein
MKTEVYEVTIECAGDIYWRQDGKLHRTDGPAVESSDGTKSWYQNDQCHRTDGPAVEYADGRKYWYIKGIQLAEQEFNKKMNPPTCNGKTVEIDGVRYKLSII